MDLTEHIKAHQKEKIDVDLGLFAKANGAILMTKI